MAQSDTGRSDFTMSPTFLLSCFFPQAGQPGQARESCYWHTPFLSELTSSAAKKRWLRGTTSQGEKRQAQVFDWSSEGLGEMPQRGACLATGSGPEQARADHAENAPPRARIGL